ncbi:MAG: Glycine cleavage system protein [Actinomycetia bacterium]|nr:Glycine cleavage system protein [Actinomycetes bacterium]
MKRTPLAAALDGAVTTTDLGVEVAAHYGDPTAEYLALRREVGVVDRSASTVVSVSGPDALSYLQSQLSQDLDGLEIGGAVHALLLAPQGKLQADLRVVRYSADELILLGDIGVAPQLVEGLERFKIRVKATIEDRTGRWGVVDVRGPAIPEGLPGVPTVVAAPADWPGLPGLDLVGPLPAVEAAWAELLEAGIARCGLDAYEAVRIEAGIPRQGHDIGESTIPQEAFLEVDAVSFTKGCFPGQELVCRIDSRGHVNKLLRGLRVTGSVQPPVGAAVVDAGGRTVGTVSSVGVSLETMAVVALATIRRDVEPLAPVSLQWDTAEVPAVVTTLPLIASPTRADL